MPATTPAITCVGLSAAGVSLVLDLSDGRLPSVLHWGAGLGTLTDGDALALVEAAAPCPPRARWTPRCRSPCSPSTGRAGPGDRG